MKNLMKPLLRIAAFFLGLVVVFGVFSLFFLPKNNTEEAGMDKVTANGILAEPTDSLDVIIVGDSESYCAFSPMIMWNEFGFTSYVYGTSGQRMYEMAHYVSQILKTQHPTMMVIEANALYRDSSIKQVVAYFGETLIPLIRYHDRWKNMTIKDFTQPVDYTGISHFKGYRLKMGIKPGEKPDYMAYTAEVAPIPSLNRKCLDLILKMCDAAGVPVMLANGPSMDNWSFPKHNGVQQYADEHGIEYYDMNLMTDEFGLDWNVDTLDKGDHLNHDGAVKTSQYFGRYLQEKLNLPDRRSSSDYAYWHECWELYQESVRNQETDDNLR